MTSQEDHLPTIATPRGPNGPREAPDGRSGHPAPGTVVADRYRIEGPLGRGAMGIVFRAEDSVLGETVALKFVLPAEAAAPDARRRVREEVRLARLVSHPNVCRVHDVGEWNGELFVSMELVSGEDLATLLKRIGRLPGDKALEIARQVAAGLAAAHAAGVLHRDLKPANVMLDAEGRARITDFGLAVAGAAVPGGEVAGTPAYMAPELLAGAAASARSDVFALGALVYELVTGRRPVEGRSLAELRARHESSSPEAPSRLVGGVDPAVERVVLRCLARDPAERPASASAVLTELCGGDAVGAALAAGLTPSPEAVAAARTAETLPRGLALGLLLAFVLPIAGTFALVAGGWLRLPVTVVDQTGLPYPPAVLAVRASDALEALGLPIAKGERVESGFAYDADAIRWAATQPHARDPEAAAHRPSRIRFLFLAGVLPGRLPTYRAAAPIEEPATLPPGAVALRLDPRGRLVRLVAAPDPAAARPPLAPDALAAAAFRLAGLEPGSFAPVAPSRLPPVFADGRRAWEGTTPERPGVRLRLELATYSSRPVSLEVSGPWSPAPTPAPRGRGLSQADFASALDALVLVAGIAFARRNLRAGNGDRTGALRLAALVFTLDLGANLLRARHGPALSDAIRLVGGIAGSSLFAAVTAWVFYLAVEPHLRRLWPGGLVSWVRLLSGRLRDPLVARDVFLGLVAYQALATAMVVLALVVGLTGGSHEQAVKTALAPLGGARFLAAALVDAPRNGISLALFYILLLVLVRSMVRRGRLAEWLFVGVLSLLTLLSFALLSGPPGPAALIASPLLAGGIYAVLRRVGVLSTAVVAAIFDLAVGVPLTADGSAWYVGQTYFILGLLFALAIASFFACRARPAVV